MKQKLISRGLSLLARREYSRRELFDKLQKYSTDKDLINEVLDYFVELNYQDDQRFIECYVRDSINSGYGPIRIKYKIQQKGISSSQINEYLDGLDINWKELAENLIDRRFKDQDLDDRKIMAKVYNFLYSRGFLASDY